MLSLDNLHVRPAFNLGHRFLCADNPPGGKPGVTAVAQVYGPRVDERAAVLSAAPDMLAACKSGLAEIDAYLAATGHVVSVEPERVALITAARALALAIAKAEGRSDA